jgi:hypothetical protein
VTEVSGKVPGEAEKWDDVIRKITSVWTPEVAAEVLAAITKLDLRATPGVGDVPTWDGSKFVPAAVGGGGSGALTVLKKGTNYALLAGDSGKLAVPTANNVVFTLPVAATGLWYMVALWSDFSNPVVVRPQAGEQIASIGEHTLAAGVGILGDQQFVGNLKMSREGVLHIYATGAGEPWVVEGVAGTTSGAMWTSEV